MTPSAWLAGRRKARLHLRRLATPKFDERVWDVLIALAIAILTGVLGWGMLMMWGR